MPKQKTNKSINKRVKMTTSGKMLRRHQFGAGHLKQNKSKSALARQKKTSRMFAPEEKKYKRLLGI